MKLTEYEDAVIGAAFQGDAEVLSALGAELSPDQFSEKRAPIYRAIIDSFVEHGKVDILLVGQALGSKLESVGGMDALRECSRALEFLSISSISGLPQWVKVVDDAGRLRRLRDITQQQVHGLDDLDTALERVENVDEYLANVIASIQKVSVGTGSTGYKGMPLLVHEWNANVLSGGMTEFVPTGIPAWDETFLGVPVGLTIMCGLPSTGKTQLALEIAYRRARTLVANKRDGTILFNSIEMSSTKLITRMACSLASVDSRKLRAGQLSSVESRRVDDAVAHLSTLPIYVDDSDYVTTKMLAMQAMSYASYKDTSMLIIDFAELIADAGADDESREQQVSGIYRGTRSIAKTLGIPVILLAQYNRGPMERDNKMGQNSDIRYSGMAEIAADQIIHIYSPWQLQQMQLNVQPPREMTIAENIAYIICGKNRDGPVGAFTMRWQPRWTRWSDLSEPQMGASIAQDVADDF